MARIKISIPNESEEHAAWAAEIRSLESIDPEKRTEEQWETAAKLYEAEPAYGEGVKTYYVPSLDAMPAAKIKSLPKELFQKNGDTGAALDALTALLSMYMPRSAAAGLTIGQMQDVMQLLKGSGAGES